MYLVIRIVVQLRIKDTIISLPVEFDKIRCIKDTITFTFHVDVLFFTHVEQLKVSGINRSQGKAGGSHCSIECFLINPVQTIGS